MYAHVYELHYLNAYFDIFECIIDVGNVCTILYYYVQTFFIV